MLFPGPAPTIPGLLRAARRFPPALVRFCFSELDLERKVCLTCFVWGTLVITLDTFAHSSNFARLTEMARWAGLDAENAWGGVALLVGGVQITAILSGRVRLRKLGALLGFSFWATISTAFILANPHTAALATFGLFSWSHAALYYQLRTGRRR